MRLTMNNHIYPEAKTQLQFLSSGWYVEAVWREVEAATMTLAQQHSIYFSIL